MLHGWGETIVQSETSQQRIMAIFFNTSDPLLSEKSVRQALGYALPAFSETPAYAPISVHSWAYNDDVKKYEPNIDEAQDLFTNAGIETQKLTLIITTFPQYVVLAQQIAN